MKDRLMYRRIILTITLLIIITACIGCTARNQSAVQNPPSTGQNPSGQGAQTPPPAAQEPPKPTISIEDYLPLKLNNMWQYEGEGNEYASYTLRVEFAKDNRYQLTRDNGGALIADIYEIRNDSIVHVYQMGEVEGVKNLLNQVNNLEDVILKEPVEVGNKWTSQENTYEIVDTKASLTVPYGTFKDCTVIKRTYKDGSEEYMHFKEGVGMLQSEFRSGNSKIFSRLKSFSTK